MAIRWYSERLEIKNRLKALGTEAWKFFVETREKLKQENRPIEFCWREAERLTMQKFGSVTRTKVVFK